jgi:putative glutamine amidotransferase
MNPASAPARRPLVALTTTLDLEAGSHRRPAVFLYTSYIAALEYSGLAPVLVTPGHDADSVAALIDAVDGLVLSGGEDVDPSRYGESARVVLDSVLPARDEMELAAVRQALARDMPVLGICRGCQVLNVALGGTLWQDLPTELTGALGHSQNDGWHRRTHDVAPSPGSRLHEIAGGRTLHINSFHHQAVREVAPTLRVAGMAADGVIEAVESPAHTWVVGVQWHPERLEATTPDEDHDRRLFAAFAGAVRDYAARRNPAMAARAAGGR